MTAMIKKGFTSYSPWFDVDVDGLPVRKGLYEGTVHGIPDEGGTFQHGYYLWNGRRWTAWGTHPDTLGVLVFLPRYWRGVIPNEDYPFDQVEPNDGGQEVQAQAAVFTGVLYRSGTSDRVVVHHFQRMENALELVFVRTQGKREPEEYRCTLARLGAEYEGAAKANVRGFVLEKMTRIRVSAVADACAELTVSLALQGVQSLVFCGVLTSQGTPTASLV